MKKLIFLLPFLVLCSYVSPPGPGITDPERMFLVKYLTETKNDFLKATQGLTEAQKNFKASPDRWSIAQCMEHIALSESRIFERVEGFLKQPADPSKRSEVKSTDDQIIRTLVDRSRKLSAPESLKPSNKFANSDEAQVSFVAQRDKTIDYVRTTQDDLRDHFGLHPAYGMLDDFQWIILIAAHSKRHTLQMEEVKADKGFPR